MNKKQMNIIDFLNEKNIDFVYIELNNKKPNTKQNVNKDNIFYFDNPDPKSKNNNMNNAPNQIFNSPNKDELIAENHKLYNNDNCIAINTNDIIWLDIDIKDEEDLFKQTEEFIKLYNKIKKDFPYHKSLTKELGFHNILCSKKDLNEKYKGLFENYKKQEISDIDCKGNFTNINEEYKYIELMCGKPLWCQKDVVVENCNKKDLPKKANKVLKTVLHPKLIDKYKNKTQLELNQEEKENIKKKQIEQIKIDENYIEDRQDLILELTKLINKDLYLDVSSTFHNIVWSLSYNNCNSSLEYIKEIGMSSPKYKFNYDDYFNKLVDKGKYTYQLSIGVIYNLARQSNNKKYIDLIGKNKKCINNNSLAELFMKSYDGDIILLRLDPDSPISVWFYNKDKNSWSCESSCDFKTLIGKINKFCIEYIINLQEKNIDEDYSKILSKFNDSLEQSIKIKNFIVSDLIEAPKSIEFDNKPHLIPFKNKIFNTKTCKFEEHRRDNYITLTLDYDFRTINEENQEYIDAKNYFEELFLWKENDIVIEEHSHRDIMNDVLYIIANCFIGRDKGDHMFIFNGRGGNGKSKLFDLLRLILDKNKYYGGVNGNLICADIDANKPSPDIANLQNKRINVLQEPSENKLLNISAIKYLTGEEYIRARKLFKNPIDFCLNATNILVCNQRLGFEGRVDNAIIRRIIDIHLPFVFSNNKINKDKKIYKSKVNLNLIDLRMGFINYIFNYITNFEDTYKKNINDIDYKFSDTTMERTKNYLLEYDYLGQFLDKYFVRSNNVYNTITIKEIHTDFKKSSWYKNLDDNKKRNFDIYDKFKRGILDVEEYKDIQFDDSKNKKGWKFCYVVKSNCYDEEDNKQNCLIEDEDKSDKDKSESNSNDSDSDDSDESD